MCQAPKPAKLQKFTKVDEKTGEIYESRRPIFLNLSEIDEKTPLQDNITMIPCGKCEECRIEQAKGWALRCYLEAQNWPTNCFITLTYRNDSLPNCGLFKRDLQLFWKRLRKKTGKKIRYMACGEYGTTTGRAHYHAAIFGWKPEDLKLHKINEIGDNLYTSKMLEETWGLGYCIVGELTYESAAYIARYVFKKAYGATENIQKAGLNPEFTLTSRKPGIGATWINNSDNANNIWRNDLNAWIQTKTKAVLQKLPEYLKKKLREQDRERYFQISDAHARELKTITRARATDKTYWYYLKDQNENKKQALKRLDKHRTTC